MRSTEVFILGAGFSKAISPEMPTTVELGQALKGRSVSERVVRLLDDYQGNVEMVLSELSARHPWLTPQEYHGNLAEFHRLVHRIRAHLNRRTKRTMEQLMPAWLHALVKWWQENQSTVISLNYDLLVEKAAQKVVEPGLEGHAYMHLYPMGIMPASYRAGIPQQAGWRDIAKFKLLKLHGSSNWFYTGRLDASGEQLFYIPVEGSWGMPQTELEKMCKTAVEDLVPLLIPPVLEKGPYFSNDYLRLNWREAELALLTASNVYCVGYSLPETDLSMRFLLSPRGRVTDPARWHVVNTDPSSALHFERILPNRFQVDSTLCGAQDAVEQLARRLRGS
jgi:hypothetical protein